MKNYQDKVHTWGRIWMSLALVMMLSIPLIISITLNTWPEPTKFLQGLFTTAIIFWTVTTIEVFTYSPMLGSAGTYLGFTTGNLTNLKVPSAMQALDTLDVQAGTEKGDVISTIAIASSTIITTLIIALGAALLLPLTPILESETLAPAFDNIIPALFGALGVVFIAKAPKIAVAPIVFMLVVFLVVPGSTDYVGIFVPIGVIIAVSVARILYKKNKL
jgi:hypothetical protein